LSVWGLYQNGKKAEPLTYSNGKTQEDVIKEIVEAFESYDIVALKGGVGTGKSAIAIHVAAHIGNGKGIIVVPTKILEDQYVIDYGGGKFKVILNDSEVKFRSIMGRSNFKCPYFGGLASRSDLPCTRSLTVTDANGRIIKIRRIDVARICPYWSPIVDAAYLQTYTEELDDIQTKLAYNTVSGKRYIVVRKMCPYYRQFLSYYENNIILMNSAIWEIETLTGRKPRTEIEVIDEADAWLDSLTFERQIATKTIQRLIDQYADDDDVSKELDELLVTFTNLLAQYDGYTGEITDDWVEFVKKFSTIFDEISREANISSMLAIDRVWMSIDAKWSKVRFFVPNLKAVFSKIRERSASKLLLMSATFPPRDVLEDVFGIDNICFIEGESKFPGTVYLRRTGKEDYINYDKWKNPDFRRKYYDCLDEILAKAKRPILIQVHSKKYLPANKLDENLNDRSIFKEEFTEAWSTIAKRGLDLKGDKCRAICVLKHPFSDLSDGMLQAIRLKLGDDAFFRYYRDKANRELIQQIGRAVRSPDDWVEVWSPDLTVHNVIMSEWTGKLVKYGQTTL